MQHNIKILTCNIRCIVARDGKNNWPYRKALCVDVIRAQEADVICFQELTESQEHDVASALADYDSYGLPDEPLSRNCVNRIFTRRDRLETLACGGYWLSDTPHIPGSRSWDSAYIRLANWIRLRDKVSGHEFRVVNTHLDCDSQEAREGQARCIAEETQAYGEAYPQILTGDMNCDTTNAAIGVLKDAAWRDTYGSVHGTEDPTNTHHDFLGSAFQADVGKMDWILLRGNVTCRDASIVTDSVDGRFPSDHYFVSALVAIDELHHL